MTAAGEIPDVDLVALARGEVVVFPCGVSLSPPVKPKVEGQPAARGGAGCYRVNYYEGGKRRQPSRRELDAAWTLAVDAVQRLRADRASSNAGQPVRTFDELCVDYLNPALHTTWSVDYPDKVTSLLRCWLRAPKIVVTKPDGRRCPLAEVRLEELTTPMLTEACSYALQEKSYSTYKEVHVLAGALAKWAKTRKFLPGASDLGEDFKRASDPQKDEEFSEEEEDGGDVGEIDVSSKWVPPERIPPTSELERFGEAMGETFGWRQRALVELLMWAGFRIGEALALRNNHRLRWDEDDQAWWVWVDRRVRRWSSKTAPPKWRKKREVLVPNFLNGTMEELIENTERNAPFFPAPRGGLIPPGRWHGRWFTPVAEALSWPELEAYLDGSVTERRWLWPPHSTRHHAATWMLSPDGYGFSEDDVAKLLGHRSGRQVWEMYGHARPDLGGRALQAMRRNGGPWKPRLEPDG